MVEFTSPAIGQQLLLGQLELELVDPVGQLLELTRGAGAQTVDLVVLISKLGFEGFAGRRELGMGLA